MCLLGHFSTQKLDLEAGKSSQRRPRIWSWLRPPFGLADIPIRARDVRRIGLQPHCNPPFLAFITRPGPLRRSRLEPATQQNVYLRDTFIGEAETACLTAGARVFNAHRRVSAQVGQSCAGGSRRALNARSGAIASHAILGQVKPM
jgi:hypothetical protein